MIHLAVGIASLVLIALMLAEFFITFLLPRRVRREPRIARQFIRGLWRPWKRAANRLPRAPADTLLGVFGPLGLIFIIAVLVAGLILGFTGLLWAHGSDLRAGAGGEAVGDDLYFSAASLLSTSTTLYPGDGLTKTIQLAEAASGYAVLFISIGYLPALFQAFSRRETAVSQLDPRSGSPPTAGGLLVRAGESGGWGELNDYLRDWETWAAELMETQLSYPILGYFRSQHVNQNWVAALTAVVDSCAFALAYAPREAVPAADNTFAVGRHALADLALTLRARAPDPMPERLPAEDQKWLLAELEKGTLELAPDAGSEELLRELRDGYERYAVALSQFLALDLPGWRPPENTIENWRHTFARHEIAAPRRRR